MKLFIAGCARSGTTLMLNLMKCFEDVKIAPEEADVTAFLMIEASGDGSEHFVIKRTSSCWENLPELPDDIELIYCVRHPYDSLTSSLATTRHRRKYHVTPGRWLSEYEALLALRERQPDRRVFFVKYEDLVQSPFQVQESLAKHFGLRIARDFRNNPDNRPIFTTSIDKWKSDPSLQIYVESFGPDFLKRLSMFCGYFGYLLPKKRESGRKTTYSFIRRLENNPIISASLFQNNDGCNINGPSLIAAPMWMPKPLGKYYLYFAHHAGAYIRLATANTLEGPWILVQEGTLRWKDSDEFHGNVASPDVHVDNDRKLIVMIFHSSRKSGGQASFIAESPDGLNFTTRPGAVGGPYMRLIQWDSFLLGFAMDGHIYRSENWTSNFTRSNQPVFKDNCFPFKEGMCLRHIGLRRFEEYLEVYFTCIGDTPERIWKCDVKFNSSFSAADVSGPIMVLRPEFLWEGAGKPILASCPGISLRSEHAVRDPAIFIEGRNVYLLYSVAGEQGIGIAEIGPMDVDGQEQQDALT